MVCTSPSFANDYLHSETCLIRRSAPSVYTPTDHPCRCSPSSHDLTRPSQTSMHLSPTRRNSAPGQCHDGQTARGHRLGAGGQRNRPRRRRRAHPGRRGRRPRSPCHRLCFHRSRGRCVLCLRSQAAHFRPTDTGRRTGSIAAAIQSSVYGGATCGLFSVLQSVGATIAAPSLLSTAAAVGTAAVGGAAIVDGAQKSDEGGEGANGGHGGRQGAAQMQCACVACVCDEDCECACRRRRRRA